MADGVASRKRKAPSAWTAFGLLLCVIHGAGGCAAQSQTHQAQEIPRYSNSNMYCREYNYSPELIPLLPSLTRLIAPSINKLRRFGPTNVRGCETAENIPH
jgi:hypothetical protein